MALRAHTAATAPRTGQVPEPTTRSKIEMLHRSDHARHSQCSNTSKALSAASYAFHASSRSARHGLHHALPHSGSRGPLKARQSATNGFSPAWDIRLILHGLQGTPICQERTTLTRAEHATTCIFRKSIAVPVLNGQMHSLH